MIATATAPPAHVAYATVAGRTYSVRPALLLAIAEHESRFSAGAVNASGACGALQVMPVNAGHCEAMMRVELLAYTEGARMLAAWRTAAGGDVELALRGFACGWRGLELHAPKPCRWFARRVLARADQYEREARV